MLALKLGINEKREKDTSDEMNHSAWYACHSAVVAKESWVRGSPAAADAASCAALKTVGISGVRRAASQGCATDYSS